MPLKCPLKSLSIKRTFQLHVYVASKTSQVPVSYITFNCLLNCFLITIIGKLLIEHNGCVQDTVWDTDRRSCIHWNLPCYYQPHSQAVAYRTVCERKQGKSLGMRLKDRPWWILFKNYKAIMLCYAPMLPNTTMLWFGYYYAPLTCYYA